MKHYIKLIQNMPVENHAVTTKKSTWNKYQHYNNNCWLLIDSLFDGKDELELSRSELKKLGTNSNGSFNRLIIATILWGYPSGMRGKNFSKILDQIDIINDLLSEATNGVENWKEHYKQVKSINGLGISTYTKLLYFAGTTVNGIPALILDKRVIDAINTDNYPEFQSIQGCSYATAPNKYPEYLSIVKTFSDEQNCCAEQVEMFLFSFGQNLKR